MRPLLLLAILGVGCSRPPSAPAASYVHLTHGLGASADESIDGGILDDARLDLLQAATLPAPHDMGPEEVAQIRRDAYARLATLELSRGRPQEALTQAQKGIAIAAGNDVFLAALYVARGRADEALGHDAEAAHDYHQALVIDEALLAAEAQPPEKP